MRKKTRTYSGTSDPKVSARELRNRFLARRAAAEGMVLLKNDNQVLPLSQGKSIALYGGGAVNTVKGGTGSGDVNERENVSIWQGLKDAGFVIATENWLKGYRTTYENARNVWKEQIVKEAQGMNPAEFFSVYTSHPFQVPSGRRITETDVQESNTDTAVFVISRIAGEASDRCLTEGDYYLTADERENLDYVCQSYAHVILVINTGAQIDLSFIDGKTGPEAIIYFVQAGMEGGNALADILSGKVNPSGKLTDTWAKKCEDYPASKTFSHNNGNVEKEYYEEGIYVGYRYFQSFGIQPRFPFGYGLSYTNFSIKPCRTSLYTDEKKQRISIQLEIKNTGNLYSGREVAQVYVSCPQTGLPKEHMRLCGFGKTQLLEPGESQKLTISFPAKALASYDEDKSAWVAQQGLYGIWAGNSSENLILIGALSIKRGSCEAGTIEAKDAETGSCETGNIETKSTEAKRDKSGSTEVEIIESTAHICTLKEDSKEASKEALKELIRPEQDALAFEKSWHEQLQAQKLPIITFIPQKEKTVQYQESWAEKKAKEIAGNLTDEQLIALVMGEVGKGQTQAAENALGSAGIMVPGAAGETTSALEEEYGIPGVSMADGPAGLRLAQKYQVSTADGRIYMQGLFDALEHGFFAEKKEYENAVTYHQYATAIPVGTLLAQSFDPELLEEVGRAVADEMEEFHISWWLAPGMNIHRDPLCGRNFEYFSEDPVVSGVMAAAITRGVQSKEGVGTTIKHFACNNQEDNRKGSDSIISERALREIYLRGFEIAIKTSQPMAVMTSYNLINGIHTANSYDLCTTVARQEWGFQGIIMTDWTTTSENGGSIPHQCIKAGNDLIMPGSLGDREEILHALAQGTLTREELKDCAVRVLTLVYRSSCFEEAVSYSSIFEGMERYLENEK